MRKATGIRSKKGISKPIQSVRVRWVKKTFKEMTKIKMLDNVFLIYYTWKSNPSLLCCDSNTYVSYSQFLEQVKWVFSRLQCYLPLAAGVYTLTAMIIFYNYNVRDWYEYRVSLIFGKTKFVKD
jgi:glutamine amidotransferase-like uncharacterized protein